MEVHHGMKLVVQLFHKSLHLPKRKIRKYNNMEWYFMEICGFYLNYLKIIYCYNIYVKRSRIYYICLSTV